MDPNLGGNGMREHILELALTLSYSTDFDAGSACHALVRTGLHKLSDPNATGITGSPARRQDMVCANGFISVRDRCLFAHEERTVVHELVDILRLILNMQFQVLGSILITQFDGFVLGLRNIYDSVVA